MFASGLDVFLLLGPLLEVQSFSLSLLLKLSSSCEYSVDIMYVSLLTDPLFSPLHARSCALVLAHSNIRKKKEE